MKIQCKYCKRLMEPVRRILINDVSVYYCSICGQELFSTGGSWKQSGLNWIFEPLHSLIDFLFTKLYGLLRRSLLGKIVFAVILIIFFIFLFKFHK